MQNMLAIDKKAWAADDAAVGEILAPHMAAPLIAIVRGYRWYDVAAVAATPAPRGALITLAIKYGLADHIDAAREYISSMPYYRGIRVVRAMIGGDRKFIVRNFARLMDEGHYAACVAIFRLIMLPHMTRGESITYTRCEMRRMIFAAPDDVIVRFISFFCQKSAGGAKARRIA